MEQQARLGPRPVVDGDPPPLKLKGIENLVHHILWPPVLVEDNHLLDMGLTLGLNTPAGAAHPGPDQGEPIVGAYVGPADVVSVCVAVGELRSPPPDPGEVP